MTKEELENKIMHDYDGTFIKTTIEKFAINKFKASLREAIEKEIKTTYGAVHVGKTYSFALNRMLELIDTVTPTETN